MCYFNFALVAYAFQVLFEPKQWDYLVDQFKQEFCKLYGMTLEPLLNIYLQAGLSALKTPYPLTIVIYPLRYENLVYLQFFANLVVVSYNFQPSGGHNGG